MNRISENQNTNSKKEQYLDGIASRLSVLKMDGKPIDGAKLLGRDLERGVKMFDLQELSPKVQADILLSLAYFRSPIFEERAAQSLGYASRISDMDELDSDIYDNIVQRARYAYKDISFEVCDDIRKSHNESVCDDRTVVHIPDGYEPLPAIFDSLGVTVHEIAHHIYGGSGTGTVNPGIFHLGKDNSLGMSLQYGLLLSPYDRINESDPERNKVKNIYSRINEAQVKDFYDRGIVSEEKYNEYIHKFADMSPGEQKDYEEYIDERLRHDNTGYERAADIHAARMIMLQEGIWNPFGNEPLKSEHIELFRQRHPNSRIFEYWNDSDAILFLNTIARNEQGNDLIIGEKRNLDQMIAAYTSKKLMGQLEELSSAMNGSKATTVTQPERDLSPRGSNKQENRRITSPLELTAMNYEAEAQTISEGHQEHRSYGHSV